jgi:7-cyano-7-deazaguanine synthase
MSYFMKKKAVILFSGGLDSTTCLAIAKNQDFECYALSFDYAQRHRAELEAAKKVTEFMKVKEHKIFSLPDMGSSFNSALVNPDMAVPDFQEHGQTIPNTYVPARNTIFLAIALGWAETLAAFDIFIGANSVDYSNYPDCRPDYIAAFTHMANLATKAGVEGQCFKIHAPLLHLTKAEIIQTGIALGVDYSLTVSCYQANVQGEACGQCDSCGFRKQGFAQAAIEDPTRYR